MAHDSNPGWWNDQHTSAWTRAKEALKRDWEQTKADFSKHKGQELNQNAADTIKQATGGEAIPPVGVANVHAEKHNDGEWTSSEPAVRYGYGAANHFDTHHAWDDNLEGKLKTDWDGLKTGHAWNDAKDAIRRGWDAGRRKL